MAIEQKKERDERRKILELHASQLMEHFDAVQILASNYDSGVTASQSSGRGNWYSRRGLAEAFLNVCSAEDTRHTERESDDEIEDDPEPV